MGELGSRVREAAAAACIFIDFCLAAAKMSSGAGRVSVGEAEIGAPTRWLRPPFRALPREEFRCIFAQAHTHTRAVKKEEKREGERVIGIDARPRPEKSKRMLHTHGRTR